MRIAPIDIAHKNFSKKFMGFDSEEVIEFLREMADQMEELIRERNSLKETLREKELNILEYRERDETLKTTITTATRMAEQIRVDAEREAKLIMHDANQKSEMIVKDARDSLKRIYQEVGEMKRARIQFEANLRSIAQAHLAMLDQSHQIMPDYQNQNMNWGMSQPTAQPQQMQQQNQQYQTQMMQQSAPTNSSQNNFGVGTQAAPAQKQSQTAVHNFGAQTNGQTISAGFPLGNTVVGAQKAQNSMSGASTTTTRATQDNVPRSNIGRATTGL